jgi:hypothetical protein
MIKLIINYVIYNGQVIWPKKYNGTNYNDKYIK